ncbi:hypothetical protein SSPS47_18915 [Streptomyces sp. S4.7]|uniref:hypothetical protein n=1 Tax=Streptomyces sp. S4.7 TaxID=2705439 RepID=UPI001398EBEB|nr:hypothetical protein [Streptomyces sp. S4.7]QHY97182.1 hypothetical protein SSPS47_18915 [Streptomyces sp. S4.7]
MKREQMWVPALTLVGGLLTGCAMLGEGEKGVAAAMNMQDAAEHADAMLDSTFEAIEPEVQWAHDDTSSGSCDLTRRRTVMTIVSEERRGNFLGMIERYWKKSGYKITSVFSDKESPAIIAKSSEGFAIVLNVGYEGQVFFKVSTPCVEESEVADPTAAPNGPAYEGVELPRPNVRSDFWSADTPVASPSPWSSGS